MALNHCEHCGPVRRTVYVDSDGTLWCRRCLTEPDEEDEPVVVIDPREARLQTAYGISCVQWDRMYTLQNGLCAICQKHIEKPGNSAGKRAAAVDHDHVTKRVRGLTCYRCNRFVIGRNRDTTRLRRLIAYLDSSFDGRDL